MLQRIRYSELKEKPGVEYIAGGDMNSVDEKQIRDV